MAKRLDPILGPENDMMTFPETNIFLFPIFFGVPGGFEFAELSYLNIRDVSTLLVSFSQGVWVLLPT